MILQSKYGVHITTVDGLEYVLMIMENMCSQIFLQSKYAVHITSVYGIEYDFNDH